MVFIALLNVSMIKKYIPIQELALRFISFGSRKLRQYELNKPVGLLSMILYIYLFEVGFHTQK